MDTIIKLKGDNCLSPGARTVCMLLLPIMAFVNFFMPYGLALAASIALVLLLVGYAGFSARYEFQYDYEKRQCRKAWIALGLVRGLWYVPDFNCKYMSLQMYNQTYTFHFLNLSETVVPETKFCIRLFNDDGSYRTLFETSCFEALPNMIGLCKAISTQNDIVFHDFVKEQARKEMR